MTSLHLLEPKQRLQTLKEMLHQYTAPAADALIERIPGTDDVRCYACGHRCLIKPGRDGVCRVRHNDNGTLRVPHGYVGVLACDPIEKKPFFHVLPGSDALTFGMLGCDFHCGYCFTPDTTVHTDRGPTTFADLFVAAEQHRLVQQPDGDAALPAAETRTIAGSGQWRRIEAVFRHPYKGPLTVIRPYYLPQIRCTPDHRVYATPDPARAPEKVRARDLTLDHYLAIPRRCADSAPQTIDVAAELREHRVTHHVRWKLTADARQHIAAATAAGSTSAQIAATLGKSASYVRHVRAKLARGRAHDTQTTAGPIVTAARLRFPHERGPGIPASLPLDRDFAKLLGFYCAEGCVVTSKRRPNSHKLNFSFSLTEADLADHVRTLLERCLGVSAKLVRRTTTLAVVSGKASAALLFRALCGGRSTAKRVPPQLFNAPPDVAQAFLDAYLAGDGHRYEGGKRSATTVSHALAHALTLLLLKTDRLPSLYDAAMPSDGVIQGRAVKRSPHQYAVVWYDDTATLDRRTIQTPDFHLIPLRELSTADYDGPVYNMQVEEEHNYLANGLLVSNCQNWVTSQMLRDPDALAPAKLTTPDQLVDIALDNGAPVIASSYNEPLITSEWAVDVFKVARTRGLKCAYISNGNGTPQVLDFLRPHVDAYKVDLKTFSDKNYRQLGGVLDNVTQTIRDLKARNFWVEIVTLLVPNFSDDHDDLRRMADFLASVDPCMPWHVTAFHTDYKFDRQKGFRDTTPDDLLKAVEYGQQAGLKYIYSGNLPGRVGEFENTRCHHCNATVIHRRHFRVLQNRVTESGHCPDCHNPLPGIWGKSSGHGDGRIRPLL